MDRASLEQVRVWMEDFRAFAGDVLRIVDKRGRIVPLALNESQQILHRKVEAQRRETGRVRVVVLKARQTGISTYFVARNYWRIVTGGEPLFCYMLAHLQDPAKNLMRMATRFPELVPHPSFAPPVLRSNQMELALGTGATIRAYTASTPGGGRGGTVHLFHSSECAYQEHAASHLQGTLQQVPKEEGSDSEVVLESTACGPTGPFYAEWRKAVSGESGYLPVFLPWFLESAYRETPPVDFRLSTEQADEGPSEVEYARLHGLSDAQMLWRRRKIVELTHPGISGDRGFRQEYPATAEEAFNYGKVNSYLSPTHVARALTRWTESAHLPQMGAALVIGMDPAPAHGSSVTALVWRRGGRVERVERWSGMETLPQAEKALSALRESGAAYLALDESEGTGVAIGEYLRRLGAKVIGVKFGSRAQRSHLYANKRVELWARMAAWVEEGQLPPDRAQPTLAEELLSVQKLPGDEKVLRLENKDRVRKRGIHSPDTADALACTFALPDVVSSGAGLKIRHIKTGF